MFIYSKKVFEFVQEIKWMIKDIVSREVSLKVFGDRFYNRGETASYPIKVVVYNHKRWLGYFDPDFYELGFHVRMMQSSKKQLHDLIKHELAHYMTFIDHGHAVQPHGIEFREFCRKMGWGEDVSRATVCADAVSEAFLMEESSVLRKIKKLMALANSSNMHEAEQAMIKSQQLLLKHNIDAFSLGSDDDDKMFLKRIMKQKKENAKMRAIAFILETFFVSTVYCRGGGYIHLEILGSAVNIEIAEYVANYLQQELDHLWIKAQRLANLKGTVAKNSFFLGLARGYCNKIKALKREYNREAMNALMVIENRLADAKAMAFPRLTTTKSNGSFCPESSALGERMGKDLTIHPTIRKTAHETYLLN